MSKSTILKGRFQDMCVIIYLCEFMHKNVKINEKRGLI
jgi:hypothetical protein